MNHSQGINTAPPAGLNRMEGEPSTGTAYTAITMPSNVIAQPQSPSAPLIGSRKVTSGLRPDGWLVAFLVFGCLALVTIPLIGGPLPWIVLGVGIVCAGVSFYRHRQRNG